MSYVDQRSSKTQPKVTLAQARKVISHYKLDPEVIHPSYMRYALKTEMEHRDLTEGDLGKTAQIVMAHLNEHPNYYMELKKMERRLSKIPKAHIYLAK